MYRNSSLLLLAALAVVPAGRAAEPDPGLAQKGYGFLKQYCSQCHGLTFKVPGFNVLDRDLLLKKHSYVVPGDPAKSRVWKKVERGEMPPEGAREQPSEADKQLLKQWIAAGAPFPEAPPATARRPFRTEKDVLIAVRDHLLKTDEADRKYQRYFTLTNLANNPAVSAEDLRLYRAALSKLANSLSWKKPIVIPRAVDADATIFNVDVRDLGWDDPQVWLEILKVYPYGLTHAHDADPETRNAAQVVYALTGCDLPYLRADWFLATASRPPLYHTILGLPHKAYDLERRLHVSVEDDFLRNKLARAAFLTSGVSKQNRLVDRHMADYGAYWKSYDFKSNEGRGNLVQFPLGPVFTANPYSDQAFEHAGGEIIFNLPNGLQGYLLVNNKGERIDEGPIDIVSDSQQTSGTPVIVNGLSCMACHKHGMIRFEDRLRDGAGVFGRAQVKVQQLFARQEVMDKLLGEDEGLFLGALEKATGPFLREGAGADRKDLRELPEPIGYAARRYVKDLSAADVAFELGLDDPQKLPVLIGGNPKLREIGLGPLVHGGALKREAWESLRGLISLYHQAAIQLRLGDPLRL
jgi:serine/threonine-protein kinase